MGIPSLNSAILYCISYFNLYYRRYLKLFVILHKEYLHEVIQIAVKNALGV